MLKRCCVDDAGGREGTARGGKRGWTGGRKTHSLSSTILRRENKQRYETERDNGGQINESVRDIMNSHTLMSPICSRHRRDREEARGGEMGRRGDQYPLARIYWLTQETETHKDTHAVSYMIWRWRCNCSVLDPSMCLLSRHIHITVTSA